MSGHDDAERLLRLYLRDHDGASSGGVHLIERVLEENRGTTFEHELAGIDAEIRRDRKHLAAILDALGITPSRTKRMVAWCGATVGRMKLNGRLVSYSPLSRVVEFEALAAAVSAKLGLWVALGTMAELDPRFDGAALAELRRGASAQLEAIDDLHRAAVRTAFAPTRTTTGSSDVRFHG